MSVMLHARKMRLVPYFEDGVIDNNRDDNIPAVAKIVGDHDEINRNNKYLRIINT